MNHDNNHKNKQTDWHLSRYFIYARIPEKDRYAALDLFQGSFVVLTSAELQMLSRVERLDPSHPAMDKFRKFGLIVDFDQTAALNASGRIGSSCSGVVTLTICTTMGCNFDCPYCFEEHRPGKMSRQTQNAVLELADKMMEAFGARKLHVMWFGGEPLLAADVLNGAWMGRITVTHLKKIRRRSFWPYTEP